MKKTTKAAIAAGAAAVLLLGGAGTLAFWSDSVTIDGGEVNSGSLALSDATCDAGWVYAAGNANAGEPVSLIVPGDSVTKDCTFTVTATGDNLEATLDTPDTVPVTSEPAAPTLQATASAAYTIDGVAASNTITSANDGDVITAAITVDFPFGDAATINANDTQGILAALDDITVTLTQTES